MLQRALSPQRTCRLPVGRLLCKDGFRKAVLAEMLLLLAACAAAQTRAQAPQAKPTVWMAPPSYDNGKCFRALFENPEGWKETRSVIDVLMYADHRLQKQFSDDELRAWFAQLRQWKLKFALEVGAGKPWGITGEKTFNAQRPAWDRVQRLGGSIHAIALDEPLLCCRAHIHKPDEYAVQETANFIALVRKNYPEIRIGDIETYPSIPLPDHLWWIEALEQRLAEMGVGGLDFYRLDVNWAEFVVFDRGTWPEVKKLEQFCRKRKLPFSLIYWASGYPALAQQGLADDATWYVSVMQQGYDYAMVRGAPDQYVLESWLEAPSRTTPDTEQFTFTRSVLDFTRRFVKRDAQSGASPRESSATTPPAPHTRRRHTTATGKSACARRPSPPCTHWPAATPTGV